MHVETNYQYLPTPYKCAIDRVDQTPAEDRSLADARQWCDAYAVTYGIDLAGAEHNAYSQGVARLCMRRFGLQS